LSKNFSYARIGNIKPLYIGDGYAWIGSNLYWDGSWKYGTDGPAGVYLLESAGLSFGTAPSGTAGSAAPVIWGMKLLDGKLRVGNSDTATEALDVVGNIKASGSITAGSGATHTPLAYGKFGSDGTKTAGSSNISCVWNATRYECTISGESFYYADYVVNVTPDGSLAIPRTGSVSNMLLIVFYNLSGGTIQPSTGFSVTVYKP
jgi:hypothetical protein